MSYPNRQWRTGDYFGLPSSCMVHVLANIATDRLRCGEKCRIDPFVTITGKVTLGNRVHVGVGACLMGTYGIELGDGVSISPGAKLFSASEDIDSVFASNPQLFACYSANGCIRVGRLAVVGSNSVVLPGATIGYGSVIGALSVVPAGATIYDNWVAAGQPVRYIKLRRTVKADLALGVNE